MFSGNGWKIAPMKFKEKRVNRINKDYLKHMLELGLPQVTIAWNFGVSRQAVHQAINYKSKIKRKEELARRLADHGWALYDIQQALKHKHRDTTVRFLKKRGIKFRAF